MKDKTKEQLIAELLDLRRRVAELEAQQGKMTDAMEALRASEEKYRSLVERAGDGVAIIQGGKVKYANERLAALWGGGVEEVLETPFTKYIHPAEASILVERYRKRMAGEDVPAIYETKLVRKDGSEVFVELNAGIITHQGAPADLVIVRDITDRKQAEQALRLSEETFRSIVKSSPMGIHIYQLEEDNRLVFMGANPAADRLLGVDHSQFIGKTIEEAFPPLAGTEIPEHYRRAARDGENWFTEQVNYESEGIAGAFEVHAFQMTPGKVAILFNEITERKRAVEALRQSEERIQNIIRHSSSMFYSHTPDHVLTYVSPQSWNILGCAPEEAMVRWQEFLSDNPVNQQGIEATERAIQTGERQPPYELELITRKGRKVWVQVDESPVLQDGKTVAIVGSLTDITARKQAEESERKQRALSDALRNALEAGASLSSSLESEVILDRLLEGVEKVVPFDGGSVLLVMPETGRVQTARIRGYDQVSERVREVIQKVSLEIASTANLRWMYEHKLPLAIPDTQKDPAWIPCEETAYLHSWIGVPIIVNQEVIAFFSLQHTVPNFFTAEHFSLLQAFAGQAALALQNARLFDEVRRRVEETAALLSTSMSLSNLNSEAILQTIGEHARSIFAADGCRIFLLEPDGETLRCELALQENQIAFSNLTLRLGEGVTGAVAASGQAEIVNDMIHDPRAMQVPGTEEGPEAIMFAPLKQRQQTIGVISIRRVGANRPFKSADLELLKAFASLAASAVSNARLFDEARRRLYELETVQAVSSALRQARSIQEMLPIFVKYSAQAIGAQSGSIYLLEESTGKWVAQGWITAQGEWGPSTGDLRHQPNEGVTGLVGSNGEIYVTANWRTDPISVPLPGELAYLNDLESGISLPLRDEEAIIGVMHLWFQRSHTFTEAEKSLLTAIADMAGNAVQRARLYEETQKRLRQISALHNIDTAINASVDLRITLRIILGNSARELGVDAAAIALLHPQSQTLEYVATHGFHSRTIEGVRLQPGEGLAWQAIIERQMVSLSGAGQKKLDIFKEENFVSQFAVPLIAKGQVQGVLQVFHRSELRPSPEWSNFLSTLAGQAAVAVDNATLYEGLQRSNLELMLAYDATIEGWSRALDLRDRETEGHTQRVTELTINLARAMGMSEEQIMHIRRGALLHDIGKMGIPDNILFKQGELTKKEQEMMRKHPQFAYDMLSPIEYLRPALDIPYCHHEKWDGSGYPRGLKGKNIPLAARLFAVVDVYDAVTSDRPYRKAWSHEEAIEYIRQEAGTHFDPQVVQAFLKIIPSLLPDFKATTA